MSDEARSGDRRPPPPGVVRDEEAGGGEEAGDDSVHGVVSVGALGGETALFGTVSNETSPREDSSEPVSPKNLVRERQGGCPEQHVASDC